MNTGSAGLCRWCELQDRGPRSLVSLRDRPRRRWDRSQSSRAPNNEVSPGEPAHVLVRTADGETKLWLEPQVGVAVSYGFDAGTVRELVDVAQNHREMIERAWHDCFG